MAKLIDEVEKKLEQLKKEAMELDRRFDLMQRTKEQETRRYENTIASLDRGIRGVEDQQVHLRGRAQTLLELKSTATGEDFKKLEQSFVQEAQLYKQKIEQLKEAAVAQAETVKQAQDAVNKDEKKDEKADAPPASKPTNIPEKKEGDAKKNADKS